MNSIYFPEFEDSIKPQTNKIVVITGTTSGTGKVAAITSLKKGAIVVVLNRNEPKAKAALSEVLNNNPEYKNRIHFVNCDLQSFASVRSAAEKLKSKFSDKGIDVLCNNAGVMALADEATVDGYDVQMQTNHLSHFLLTKLLFPLLSKCADRVGEARVVNHSSGARLLPPTPLSAKYLQKNGGNLGGNGNSMVFAGARWQRYHQTKLANSVFTCEMQKRLDQCGSKVISLCAHPGFANTELQVTTYKQGGLSDLGFMKNAQSAEDGTMGILKCMFMPDLVKGGMYGPLFTTGPATYRWHGILTTDAAGKMLWEESEKACGPFDLEKLSQSKL